MSSFLSRTRVRRAGVCLSLVVVAVFAGRWPGWGPAAGGEPAPSLVPENLARGKPAKASSVQDASRAAGKGNDGQAGSRWCASGPRPGEWWQVDLGKPEDLTGCRITWELAGRAYRYRVEGSADGSRWTTLVDQTKTESTAQVRTHAFRARGIRQLRLTVTDLPEGAWPSFHEFEAHGTRLVQAPAPGAADKAALLATVQAPAGFAVTLFAAPPQVAYPTCLAAAPDGTLFVGVDRNGSLGARPGQGEVVRCLDRDGDGQADHFTTFCKVDSPRGLWFDDNTLIVLHPPYLTAFHDTDADGVADRQVTLVSGLGFDLKTRGADHTTNGFRMAIDGFLYIAVGDYGAVKAVGKDGAAVQLHGGGVMRVRPDGRGLEVVCDGLRNIYDVAVSPRLDLFSRDNTNDGGGWNVRLSHLVPTGHYGYPTRFTHFPDEIVPPLADYGGGSPCGALYLDEPGFPDPFGSGLYTCEWGRSAVYRHPLTASGAGWKAGQTEFVRIPRPTDLDVDGAGRLYLASWKDGGFNFSDPNVGFVARVTPKGRRLALFPDLKKAGHADLLAHLAAPSAVLRLHSQRELLRRGAGAGTLAGLEQLARHDSPAVQAAAACTLGQLGGKDARDALVRLAERGPAREYALRALADNRPALGAVPAAPFVAALADADPRLRLLGAIGCGRLGQADAAAALLPRTADADPLVAHVAVNALVGLRAADVCLKAVADGRFLAGACRVLQALHEPKVVEGLIAAARRASDPKTRQALLRTLARLHHREADWDGRWWGTRPDTSGPYFKPVAWAATPAIADFLRETLARADAATLRWLLPELARHRVDLPELTPLLLKHAAGDTTFRDLAVGILASRSTPPAEAVALFQAVAGDGKAEAAQRTRALRALQRLPGTPAARTAALEVLTSTGQLPGEMEALWGEFVRDGRHVNDVDAFVTLTTDPSAARRELAYAVLATIASRSLGAADRRAAAAKVVADAWGKPAAAVSLLDAITRLNLSGYTTDVRRLLTSDDARVAAAAKRAAARLKLDRLPAAALTPIKGMPYDQVLAALAKVRGDVTEGARVFNRAGCVNCHTVAASEPVKGPYLGGIAARYQRGELLESILRPGARIAQGFETHVFTLDSGKQLTGFVVREGGSEVELRDGTGASLVIRKSSIEERGKSKVSVMPDGLADPLTLDELASLLDYLASLKK